jgi:hypothetical protein
MARMNAALRTTLGWIAAVLVNLGAVLFVIGLVVPRAAGGVPLAGVGAVCALLGVGAGAVWMLAAPRR